MRRFFASFLILCLFFSPPAFALRQGIEGATESELAAGMEEKDRSGGGSRSRAAQSLSPVEKREIRSRDLIRRHKGRDPEAFGELVKLHQGLLRAMMKRGSGSARSAGLSLEPDDFSTAVLIGLLDGADSFDPTRGVQSTTHIMWKIRSRISREIRAYRGSAKRIGAEDLHKENHPSVGAGHGLLAQAELLERMRRVLNSEEFQMVRMAVESGLDLSGADGQAEADLHRVASSMGVAPEKARGIWKGALPKVLQALAAAEPELLEEAEAAVTELGWNPDGSLSLEVLSGRMEEVSGATRVVVRYLQLLKNSPEERNRSDFRAYWERISESQRGTLALFFEAPSGSIRGISRSSKTRKYSASRGNLAKAVGMAVLVANARREDPESLAGLLWRALRETSIQPGRLFSAIGDLGIHNPASFLELPSRDLSSRRLQNLVSPELLAFARRVLEERKRSGLSTEPVEENKRPPLETGLEEDNAGWAEPRLEGVGSRGDGIELLRFP